MKDGRVGQLEPVALVEVLPGTLAALTLMSQRFPPHAGHIEPNQAQLLCALVEGKVLVESSQRSSQILTLQWPSDVHIPPQPDSNFIEEFSATLGARNSNDSIPAFKVRPTNVLKSQELKAPVVSSPVSGGKPSKRYRSGLLFRQLETEFRKSRSYESLETLGLPRPLKENHEVICEADEFHPPTDDSPGSLLKPKVQSVVEIDIRQYRRNRSPLGRPFYRLH